MFVFLLICSIVIINFVIAILVLQNEKKNRLIWHLVVCFFPIIGPLVYFAYKKDFFAKF